VRASLQAVLAVVLVAGCSSAAPPTPIIVYVTPSPVPAAAATASPTAASTTAPTPSPTTPPPPGEDSPTSRDNPVALGQAHQVGDWLVSVAAANPDAWTVIKAENSFNSPPAAGNNYVMVTINATYTGEGKGSLAFALDANVVGSTNVAYSTVSEVVPDQCYGVGDVFSGGSASCNLSPWEVPTGEVASLVMYISETFGGEDVWFALR